MQTIEQQVQDIADYLELDGVGRERLAQTLDTTASWSEETIFVRAVKILAERKQAERREILETLLALNGGSAIGLEMRHRTRSQWAAIFPDASIPGKFRHQYFDERGFFAHETFASAEEALMDAIKDGYVHAEPGILDRVSMLPAWAEGLKALAEIQRLNTDLWRKAA